MDQVNSEESKIAPPTMVKQNITTQAQKPVVIEPIENYKGKSVEELEAILDAYNA